MGELERLGPRPHDPGPEGRLTAGDIPVLAREIVWSSLRIGAWATRTGVDAGRRALDVAVHPSHAGELAEDVRAAAAAFTAALLGDAMDLRVREAAAESRMVRVLGEVVETVVPLVPGGPAGTAVPWVPGVPGMPVDGTTTGGPVPGTVQPEPVEHPLHQAGQDLLRRSRDVDMDDRGHPAYARIIEELAPDEGRILMLLLRKGPQASVDVRTGGLVGTVSSDLVQPNLTMIGALAGCRFVDRVPSYLHNLERLGLIWFSGETVRDPMDYQVLEAQPDVLESMASVRRAKVVRRSIQLTPFGEDFCRDGLGLHLSMEEMLDVPRHGRPRDD